MSKNRYRDTTSLSPDAVPGPNILLVEAAAHLLAKERRRRFPSGYDDQADSGANPDLGFFAKLRSRGYYTAQAVCYLLAKDDVLPAAVSGFDSIYNIFFCGSDQLQGKAFDPNPQVGWARRVSGLNDDVVACAISFVTASIARRQPFYLLCGLDVSLGSQEFDRCVSQLRLGLQQLGVEQDTLLLQRLSDPVRRNMRAA